MMRNLYYKRNPHIRSNSKAAVPSETPMKVYLEELAMEQHRSALLGGSPVVYQWNGHSVRINSCRMKRGMILTGVGDKIVGLNGSQLCIWRRTEQRNVFQSREGIFSRGLCMRYIDPEAVIGCEDGRARVLDMYSGSCSQIIRMHGGAITSLALTDDHLILGGCTFGTIAIADLSTGERLAVLKSAFAPTGIKSISFNIHSFLLFAGSTSGYAHCWDLRTLRPVWETRVSPNVIYAAHHLSNDTSTLVVGGLDGVLRILNQNTGEILSSLVMDPGGVVPAPNNNNLEVIQKRKARVLSEDTIIDRIPRSIRPPITCLAVGMEKIVTTHNEKFIRMWRFH